MLGLNDSLRGRPCPVAGRSLRPSWPPFARSLLRFAIHGCARILRRLSEHGRPLAFSAERCASRRCCIAVSRAPDWPPGRRRFDERAEPAQAKTGRMPVFRVKPLASSGARITQDWPSGRRPPCRRAEPAQAKTGRMTRVEPIALPTGRRDGGPHAGGRSPPKRKRAGCPCFA